MLLNRYKLPITARDQTQLASELMTYLEVAYGARVDEVNVHELLSLQRDWISLVGEVLLREGERASFGANIATAIEARHILYIAYWAYGYVPSGPKASEYIMALTAPADVGLIIPAGTVLRTAPTDGSEPTFFEVSETAIKPVGFSALEFLVQHGETRTEDFVATGQASQVIEIQGDDAVVTDSVIVTVNNELWEKVDTFAASTPASKHFRVIVTEPEPFVRRYSVLFGDGNLGSIPPGGTTITIQALVGGGTDGNVDIGAINTFDQPLLDLSNNPVEATVVNTTQSQRGQDAEPIDATRYKAPLTVAIHGGVVSKDDYASAALLKGASRAVAYTREDQSAIAPNIVALYVAIDESVEPTDAELETLKADIEDTYRTNGTAQLVMVPIQFEDFSIDVDVYVQDGADPASTLQNVLTTTNTFFSFNSYVGPVPTPVIDIGRPINLSNYVAAIEALDGVDHVEFPTQSLTTLEPEPGMLPRVAVNLAVF